MNVRGEEKRQVEREGRRLDLVEQRITIIVFLRRRKLGPAGREEEGDVSGGKEKKRDDRRT